MPNLHKVVFAGNIEVTEKTAEFLQEYCPAHGQLGEAGAYYVNEDVVKELKMALGDDLSYGKHTAEIMKVLNEIGNIVSREGLYEFYLED